MTWLSDIEKIKDPSFALAFLGSLMIFAPGISYIFFFLREMITNLDIFKLLFLSIAIIAPFFLLNFFCYATWCLVRKKDPKTTVFISMMFSLMLPAFILYMALLIAYIAGLDFRHTILGAVAFQIIISALFCYTISKGSNSDNV